MSQQGSASGVGASECGRGGRGGGCGSIGGGHGGIGGGRGSDYLGSGGCDQSVSGDWSMSGDRSVSGSGGRGGGDRNGASVDLHSLSRVRGPSRGQPPMFWEGHDPGQENEAQHQKEAWGIKFFIYHDSLPNDI